MNQISLEIVGAISAVLAVAGVLLNNRKMIACFYVWIVSNTISACLHFNAELYSLLARDVVFILLAFDGFFRWRKK